ncbi:MAG: ABC transporter ATP-binding protein [Dehalococcoidia bacterium]
MIQMDVRCASLTKYFGSVRALDRLDLSVSHGQILVLLGPSGCGKTTALRLIAGLEVPDVGTVEIGGRLVAGPGIHVPPEQRRVGIVFQDYALFPHLTVADNISYGVPRGQGRRDRIREIMSLVGLAGLESRMPHELSGGQQQRVALARALAPQPEVILLDEPFSNLDADLRLHVREEVRHILKRTETTAIFVTHDQEEGFSLADRLAVLNAGRLEQVDKPEVLYNSPATRFVADFVGHADFIAGYVENCLVHTELGTFPCEQGFPSGSQVEVMIRPDNLSLTSDPEGAAIVVDKRFLGSFNQYALRFPSGELLHAYTSSSILYPEETRLRVELKTESVAVFPSDEAS